MSRIDRKKVVGRHNPVLHDIDYTSPLTVGNGFFAYTFDITGMQTLEKEYAKAHMPLCTMSEWGWHTTPFDTSRYTCSYDELEMTPYDYNGRPVTYAVEMKEGNERVYEWLRHNPHRFSLAQLGLLWDGEEIEAEQIAQIRQELDLYQGIAHSCFRINDAACEVQTACGGYSQTDWQGSSDSVREAVETAEWNSLGVIIHSHALTDRKLTVRLRFAYPSRKMDGCDWQSDARHTTRILASTDNVLVLQRFTDQDSYFVRVAAQGEGARIRRESDHEFHLSGGGDTLSIALSFYRDDSRGEKNTERRRWDGECARICGESRLRWQDFWDNGGMLDFGDCIDERAVELERRIILSLYLTALQCTGHVPPQETGLTCNSWYGKFHLEMHLWHAAYLPLWNRGRLLERSLPWYESILDKARDNAARNGFKGARWPKMVSADGVDSPSVIATLLIWQQPHILYMLELLYQEKCRKNPQSAGKFLLRYFGLVRETAEFMSDFAVYNEKTKRYDLLPPIIPAQECYAPQDTVNPAFETEYWRFGLEVAVRWAVRTQADPKIYAQWQEKAAHMAELPVSDGLYVAHQNCPDTFENYHTDHPSMVAALGLLPGKGVDVAVMKRTLDKVCECWDFDSMWGWDFAMMAMTAVRMGEAERAVDLLLWDKPKNSYVDSGNNYQKTNEKLPLYLPGNGSLLLAVPMMLSGYGQENGGENGEKRGSGADGCPGFPADGRWKIHIEDINGFPY